MLQHARRCFTRRSSLLIVSICYGYVGACDFETAVIPATQIVVDIDADNHVRRRTSALELTVTAAGGRGDLESRSPVWHRVIKRLDRVSQLPQWPVRVVLTPKNGDERRIFALEVTATDRDDDFVGEARVFTGYVKNEIRHVQIRMNLACVRVLCGPLATCQDGDCIPAWRDPKHLPLLPGPDEISHDAGEADAASDASVDANDMAPDAGLARDASVDASDSAPDASGVRDASVSDGNDPPVTEPSAGPPRADRCQLDNGGCDPKTLCRDNGDGVRCGACPAGFRDVRGDGTACDDIDECAADNGGCHAAYGLCSNVEGGHECRCADGYFGDGFVCSSSVPCGDDANVCDARATCTDVMGERLCVCGPGFEGNGGQCKDIDECSAAASPCPEHTTCVNSEGAYRCPCISGYTAGDGEACIDIDECSIGADDCDDRPEACVNTTGSYRCDCPRGFSGDGRTEDGCKDIDECRENTDNCSSNALCTNERGGFRCECNDGYTGNGENCRREEG